LIGGSRQIVDLAAVAEERVRPNRPRLPSVLVKACSVPAAGHVGGIGTSSASEFRLPRPYKIGPTIAPISAPSPGSRPSSCQASVPGCSALNTDLAMSPTMITMSRPPMNPSIAPKGIMAMIIAGRRLLVAGEFDGALLVDIDG
jgi:hypothetical protein